MIYNDSISKMNIRLSIDNCYSLKSGFHKTIKIAKF